MQSFNVAILAPPLFPESNEEGWAEFPVIVRIGDRGAQNAVTSDIGALELYAQNVIPEDPFEVMAAWQHHRAETNYQAVLHSAIA
jgi:L-alanine-DL-glutamate epimerase-like enolase superfamily enzyme